MLTAIPEAPILTPDQRNLLPPAYRLDMAVQKLAAQGAHRSLIEFVEAWIQADEPSVDARLAQARALVRLGLVDRAWARLQGLIEDTAPSVQAYTLTIELFVARRWHNKARELAARAVSEHPEDPGLVALCDRLADEAIACEPAETELDDTDPEVLVIAAHQLMCTGAHTNARTLLERAQKAQPDHTMARDLLWALDGDLMPTDDLHTLVSRHAPDLNTLADIGDEPEHTESASRAELPPEDRADSAAFPSLFRGLEPQTEMLDIDFQDHSDEVTKISKVAHLSGLDALSDTTNTHAGEVTEIQRVVHHGGEPESTDTAFDLVARDSDFTSPEAEDEDVVLLTRAEDNPPQTTSGPASDLRLDPALPPHVGARLTDDEAETWVRPRPDLADDVAAADMAEVHPRPGGAYWLAALLTVSGASLLGLVLLVLMGLWS